MDEKRFIMDKLAAEKERNGKLANQMAESDARLALLKELAREAGLEPAEGETKWRRRRIIRAPRSQRVHERIEAMRTALRENGPMGPTDLTRWVQDMVGADAVTQFNIIDTLRKRESPFKSLGDGRWAIVD